MNDTRLLKKTCGRILEIEDNYNIDMSRFRIEHPCKTTFCIVGILAHEDDYPEKYYTHKNIPLDSPMQSFDYNMYVRGELLDVFQFYDAFCWLFDMQWPDTLEHAKERAQYLINNNYVVPKNMCVHDITLDLLKSVNMKKSSI